MFKSLSILFVAFCVQGALSLVVFEGECPTPAPLEQFDLDSYMGKWYGIKRLPGQAPNVDDRRCASANYTNLGDNNLRLDATSLPLDSDVSHSTTWDGFYLATATFSFLIDETRTADQPNYYVVGTDYTKWSAVWNCVQLNSTQYTLEVNVISRERTLDQESENAALSALSAQGVDNSALVDYNQENCPSE